MNVDTKEANGREELNRPRRSSAKLISDCRSSSLSNEASGANQTPPTEQNVSSANKINQFHFEFADIKNWFDCMQNEWHKYDANSERVGKKEEKLDTLQMQIISQKDNVARVCLQGKEILKENNIDAQTRSDVQRKIDSLPKRIEAVEHSLKKRQTEFKAREEHRRAKQPDPQFEEADIENDLDRELNNEDSFVLISWDGKEASVSGANQNANVATKTREKESKKADREKDGKKSAPSSSEKERKKRDSTHSTDDHETSVSFRKKFIFVRKPIQKYS